MTEARWTLRNRIRFAFTIGIAAAIAGIAGLSLVYLQGSLQRELSGLCSEEVDELVAHFSISGFDRDALTEVVDELRDSHPANPMAWRFWREGSGERWEVGDVELLPPAGDDWPAAQPPLRIEGHRWRTVEVLDETTTVELVLDGSTQVGFLRRYESFTGVLMVLGALLAFGAANLMASRISGQLTAVATRARRVHIADAGIQLHEADAPDEIRAVSEALSEMHANIRSEHEHARLLIAGLAHELRSPIQNLVGETEVTLLSDRPDGEYRRVLESHLDELRDLGHAVDNLVTLCSREAAFDKHTLEDFDLAHESLLRLQRERSTAERRGVDLSVQASGDLSVRADREALLRAVRNIVANAVEWSPPGGRVDVELVGRNGQVRLTVDDEGPGVEGAERERIFEPFYRGPAAAGRRMGFGLGLALARGAAESHGGGLCVEDSPLGGARFVMSFPRAPRGD